MACNLPKGTIVRFTPRPLQGECEKTHTARIEGTDLHGSKYRLALHMYDEVWTQPTWWGFENEVEVKT